MAPVLWLSVVRFLSPCQCRVHFFKTLHPFIISVDYVNTSPIHLISRLCEHLKKPVITYFFRVMGMPKLSNVSVVSSWLPDSSGFTFEFLYGSVSVLFYRFHTIVSIPCTHVHYVNSTVKTFAVLWCGFLFNTTLQKHKT